MKSCGIPEIDKKNKALLKEAKTLLLSGQKENLELFLQKIQDFRTQLAYNKATEMLESNFGWTDTYEKIIASIQKVK